MESLIPKEYMTVLVIHAKHNSFIKKLDKFSHVTIKNIDLASQLQGAYSQGERLSQTIKVLLAFRVRSPRSAPRAYRAQRRVPDAP